MLPKSGVDSDGNLKEPAGEVNEGRLTYVVAIIKLSDLGALYVAKGCRSLDLEDQKQGMEGGEGQHVEELWRGQGRIRKSCSDLTGGC